MAKCKRCIYGAKDINNRYNFNMITKKINNQMVTLYYDQGDCGCRMSQWTDKELKCLNNDFSEFQQQ